MWWAAQSPRRSQSLRSSSSSSSSQLRRQQCRRQRTCRRSPCLDKRLLQRRPLRLPRARLHPCRPRQQRCCHQRLVLLRSCRVRQGLPQLHSRRPSSRLQQHCQIRLPQMCPPSRNRLHKWLSRQQLGRPSAASQLMSTKRPKACGLPALRAAWTLSSAERQSLGAPRATTAPWSRTVWRQWQSCFQLLFPLWQPRLQNDLLQQGYVTWLLWRHMVSLSMQLAGCRLPP